MPVEMRGPRVLHVMASGAWGGGAQALLGLLPALKHQGTYCVAIVGDDGPLAQMLQQRGIEAYSLPMMGHRLQLGWAHAAMQKAQRLGIDIVHAHGTRAAFSLAFFGYRRPRLPIVYHVHGLSLRLQSGLLGRWARRMGERIACLGATRVVSVSQKDIEALRAHNMLWGKRAYFVANAVACESFFSNDLAARQRARNTLKLSDDIIVLGSVSRLVPQKDVMRLVDAAAHMHDRVHVVVIGDGPHKARLIRHRLFDLGRLHLLGQRHDVPHLLPAFDLLCLTSLWEGEPIALLEATASGIGWVATATFGAQQLHDDLNAGYLVPVDVTARALAATLTKLLQAPGAIAQRAQEGLKSVRRRGYKEQALRINEIYRAMPAQPNKWAPRAHATKEA